MTCCVSFNEFYNKYNNYKYENKQNRWNRKWSTRVEKIYRPTWKLRHKKIYGWVNSRSNKNGNRLIKRILWKDRW